FLLFAITSFSMYSCSNTTSKNAKEANNLPADSTKTLTIKRSELAILMRNLFNETAAYKKTIEKNQEPFSFEQFEKFASMHTATPTDAGDSGKVFVAYSKSFLHNLKMLTEKENVSIAQFNNMIDGCVACHTDYCPGPIKVISKLKIPNS